MTCQTHQYSDRAQLMALGSHDADAATCPASSATTGSTPASSTPQKSNSGFSHQAERDRAYSQAIQHRPNTSARRFFEGQANAHLHAILSRGR